MDKAVDNEDIEYLADIDVQSVSNLFNNKDTFV